MTGLEAASQLMGELPDVVVILMSAFEDEGIRQASQESGAFAFGSPQSLPCGATWASEFLNLPPQYRPLRRIFFECSRLMAQVPNQKLSDGDAQIRHLLAVIRRAAPFSSRPAPPTELPCYERFPRW